MNAAAGLTEVRVPDLGNFKDVAVCALKALADDGKVEPARVQEAIERYEINAEAPMPTTV